MLFNSNEPERACELECRGLQGLPARHEFVGPVKILLVESSNMEYQRKLYLSAMIALSFLFLGVPASFVIYYTLEFKLPPLINIHVFICTMGLQLLMAPGILMLSSFFGGAMYLTPRSRRIQHIALQVLAMICGVAGTMIMFTYMTCSAHAVTGCFGVFFSMLASVLGPGAYYSPSTKGSEQFNRKIHMLFGVPGYICSTLCFLTTFTEIKFINWLGYRQFHLVLFAMVVVYFLCVLASIYVSIKSNS